MEVARELRESGLVPATWTEALVEVRTKLSPADWDRFLRLHRNFIGYRTEETLAHFYDFVFSHDLQLEINQHRFPRLTGILEDMAEEITPGLSILDIGAGSGLIAGIIKRRLSPSTYVVQDPCADVRASLTRSGFSVLPHPAPAIPPHPAFDLILCVDSLGEVNADEDGMLSETNPIDDAEFEEIFAERFGIAQKLRPWRPYLAKEGRVLLWEPLKNHRAWKALVTLLREDGWNPTLRADRAAIPHLELKLA